MIRRPKIGNGLGYLGLGLSSLYPLLLFLDAAKHHFNREQFMMFLDDLFYVWLLVWPVGLYYRLPQWSSDRDGGVGPFRCQFSLVGFP